MASRTAHYCLDAHDPAAQARWWVQVLDDYVLPAEEEVERLLGLGATMVDDRRTAPDRGWAVLADPEGNELCMLRPDDA